MSTANRSQVILTWIAFGRQRIFLTLAGPMAESKAQRQNRGRRHGDRYDERSRRDAAHARSLHQALKRQVADYYNQIGLQIDQWSAWGDVGITETYFREVAFVLDPELRLRAGTFDPTRMRRFLSASGAHGLDSYAEVRGTAPEIGATRADADRILERMRKRPNFEGYLRDSMYWAQLAALLLDGVILSAEELEATIAAEIEALRR